MTTSFAVPLSQIEDCFQGIVPATVATVSIDGVPNITELSIVHRIDDEHVALSRQFFNKTTRNLEANPRGEVILVESVTARQFKLTIVYERTETEGPLFDAMSARLEAVASQCGMSKVFRLTAADICRVVECTTIPVDHEIPPPDRPPLNLRAVDEISARITGAATVDELLTESLEMLAQNFGYDHGFIMLVEESGESLYTVASHGYEDSGAGSEVCFGEGALGVAAERRMTVSLANMRNEMSYSRTVRSGYEGTDAAADIQQEIALPGLPDVSSQHIVPILARDQLLGALLRKHGARAVPPHRRFRVPPGGARNRPAAHLTAW
ncbi:MAG TPA: pyridoxamine 5'-phosphate oxidase family protein [Dehalococcoidia bacterium]|nr:pyridoxamine 5'-phosphate oxidase family protein [Dehalococcoidia bacterium]